MRTKAEIERSIKKLNLWFMFLAIIGSLAALLGTVVANTISISIMFFAFSMYAWTAMNTNKLLLEMKRMSDEE